VTVRSLETLIRLATAHAKSRLANKVETRDAEVAIELVRYACFKKVLEKEGKRSGKRKEISSESDDSEDDEEAQNEMDVDTQPTETLSAGETQATLTNNKRRKKQRTKTQMDDDTQMVSQVPSSLPGTIQSTGSSSSYAAFITGDRLKVFKSMLFKLFHRERTQALQMSQINEYVQSEFSSVDEIKAALNMMQDDNQIMISDDTVFII
jgi:DNA replication licensing factor MCM3